MSCDWSIAIFTTSSESQESYLTLRNLTLQITHDFFRLHNTFARLCNAATSPTLRLRSADLLAIIFACCDPFCFVTCLKLLISFLDKFSLITEWQYGVWVCEEIQELPLLAAGS